MATARILIVEDNPLNLKLVRDVLTVSGYEVVAAPSGEEGVTLAQTCEPDLVLMDIQLPGIDGYLSKPISVRSLPSQVHEYLSNGRADVS